MSGCVPDSEVLGSSGVRAMSPKNWMYKNRFNCEQ
jgi:hypothetical protein